MTRIVHALEEAAGAAPVVLAAGVFDGVHRGHQMLIQRAREEARARGGEAWALTFDPHPARLLRPGRAPALLTTTPHKTRILADQALAGVIVLPFTKELSHIPPEPFLEQLRERIPSLCAIVVGENWKFGHNASGDAALLRSWAARAGIETLIMERLTWHDAPISSTRIREAIRTGHLDRAESMLGRPVSVFGPVVHGDSIGRKLGFPTANIEPRNEVLPPPGIYAVRTKLDNRALAGTAYIPDIHREETASKRGIVEVHLLDFSGDLYGTEIEVFFAAKLRDDIRFENSGDLKAQIARDVEKARDLLRRAQP